MRPLQEFLDSCFQKDLQMRGLLLCKYGLKQFCLNPLMSVQKFLHRQQECPYPHHQIFQVPGTEWSLTDPCLK